MRQQRRISQNQLIFEQIALLFASFVWTTVILSGLVLVWAIQDMESNWDLILGVQATAVAPEAELALAIEPTPTPWPTSTPTSTPTETPTETAAPPATPTQVAQPPLILPDTPNQDDPTPVSIIAQTATALPTKTHTPKKATATPSPAPTVGLDLPTPTSTPTPTPTQPAQSSNEPPSRLVITSVGIDSEIKPVSWNVVEQNGQQYSIWQVADYAVGWHNTTALPGQPGNTVMAGHHNIKGEVFRDLVNVEVGDEVVVYTKNGNFTYKIELKTIVKEKGESLEVRQKNAEWIAATTDERITMVTCWPYTNNTHRVIVVAKPSQLAIAN